MDHNAGAECAPDTPMCTLDDIIQKSRADNEWIDQLTDRLVCMSDTLEGTRPEKENAAAPALQSAIEGSLNRLQCESSKRHDKLVLLENAINRLAQLGIV